ncbi:unnamed protein product [Prunus brigantina]
MASSFLKIESLLGLLTIRLADDNFLKWSYQIESVLQGYELFGHFDGSSVPHPQFAIVDEEGDTSELTTAYKEWIRTDKALLSLLIASLSDEALEYVIGCKTARDAWINLSDRYASVSRARINHLKTELQTAQKGGDSIERFLLRLKHLRDQLNAAALCTACLHVAHAAYLINLMPSSVLRYQSPFQSLYGKVPDIKSLRIFGTAVYPYIRPYNEHKLQPRTAQCVFMGYSPGYKGVICYNRSTSRFVVSRHVIHDETVFPFKSQSISADSVPISCSSQTQPLPICVSLPPCIHALNPSDISGSISPQHVSSQNHSSQNVSISSLESTENPALSSSDSVLCD